MRYGVRRVRLDRRAVGLHRAVHVLTFKLQPVAKTIVRRGVPRVRLDRRAVGLLRALSIVKVVVENPSETHAYSHRELGMKRELS